MKWGILQPNYDNLNMNMKVNFFWNILKHFLFKCDVRPIFNKHGTFLWGTENKIKIKKEMFQKHLCPSWCKIQVYLLCRSKTCTKQGTKGSKYIKWTTHWAQKSSLTLTFEHVTWKSIGIIYLLRATPTISLVLIK